MLTWPEASAIARARQAITRHDWPDFTYITAHRRDEPPPVVEGEVITPWWPTEDDQQATDWEIA